MFGTAVNQSDVMALRAERFIFTRIELAQIFASAVARNAAQLNNRLRRFADEHRTNIGALLFHARDVEGRTALHYAVIGHNAEAIKYLVSPAAFSEQEGVLGPFLRLETCDRGESAALYAIRQRCPPALVHRIIKAGRVVAPILKMTTAEGLGAVHCAAAADAPELILLLVEKHKLDPTQAITRDPKDGDAPYLFPEPVLGDTPMHLAARYDNVAAFEALHGTLDLGMAGPLNSEGECPMGVAISVNARAVLKYIKRLGKPRLSSPDEARRMLLKRRIEDVN